MNRTRPVFMQFYQVQLRAVAFVLAETILGEKRAEVPHNRVPRHFCDHACGRDSETVAVAVYDGRLGQGKGKNRQSVDQNVLRLDGESGQSRAHCLVSRTENV